MPQSLDTMSNDVVVPKPKVLFVLGGPGAGKGTACTASVNLLGMKHISAGDCLREAQADPCNKNGQLIKEYIKDGKIVPVDITVNLMREKIYADDDGNESIYLIDGFPRNKDNYDGWENNSISQEVDVIGCLFLDCTEDVMIQRCLNRGGDRTDDNIESLKKRFVIFREQTQPIVEIFKSKNLLKTMDTVAVRDANSYAEEIKQIISAMGIQLPTKK